MYWINKMHIGKTGCQFGNRTAYILESRAEILATMTGNDNHARRRVISPVLGARLGLKALGQACQTGGMCADLSQRKEQSVDNRISGDDDPLFGYPFLEQIRSTPFGGCEMQLSETGSQDPVCLLRPWRIHIPGAQTRLDVSNRYTLIKGSQRCAKDCCCVALHQHHIRSLLAQIFADRG